MSRRLRLGAGCVMVMLSAGCTGAQAPGEEVPELANTLSRVDNAIGHHDYRQARRELQGLARAVIAARKHGQLDAEQAERVLTATAGLTSSLPKPARPPSRMSSPDGPRTGGDGEDSHNQQRPNLGDQQGQGDRNSGGSSGEEGQGD